MTRHQVKQKAVRAQRKRLLAIDDMKNLSDELQRRAPTIETALVRITESLIILLEAK